MCEEPEFDEELGEYYEAGKTTGYIAELVTGATAIGKFFFKKIAEKAAKKADEQALKNLDEAARLAAKQKLSDAAKRLGVNLSQIEVVEGTAKVTIGVTEKLSYLI